MQTTKKKKIRVTASDYCTSLKLGSGIEDYFCDVSVLESNLHRNRLTIWFHFPTNEVQISKLWRTSLEYGPEFQKIDLMTTQNTCPCSAKVLPRKTWSLWGAAQITSRGVHPPESCRRLLERETGSLFGRWNASNLNHSSCQASLSLSILTAEKCDPSESLVAILFMTKLKWASEEWSKQIFLEPHLRSNVLS